MEVPNPFQRSGKRRRRGRGKKGNRRRHGKDAHGAPNERHYGKDTRETSLADPSSDPESVRSKKCNERDHGKDVHGALHSSSEVEAESAIQRHDGKDVHKTRHDPLSEEESESNCEDVLLAAASGEKDDGGAKEGNADEGVKSKEIVRAATSTFEEDHQNFSSAHLFPLCRNFIPFFHFCATSEPGVP